jgi:hypothetical protein
VSKRGESPSFFIPPPLLLKERGIKGEVTRKGTYYTVRSNLV